MQWIRYFVFLEIIIYLLKEFCYFYINVVFFKKKNQFIIFKIIYFIQRGYFDDKCKYIIDEGVECFVGYYSLWKMGYRFYFVIDEQLRCYYDEI